MDSSRSMTSGEKRKVQGVWLTLDKGVDSSRLVRSAVKMRNWGVLLTPGLQNGLSSRLMRSAVKTRVMCLVDPGLENGLVQAGKISC